MDCDTYGPHIEQLARGALPEAQRAALEAHLAGCAACRSLAGLAGRVEGELAAHARGALAAVDWRRFERELGRQTLLMRWVIPLVLVGMGTAVTIALARKPADRSWLALPFGGFWTVTVAAGWVLSRRWLRRWLRGAAEGEELLAFYRRWLDERARDTRQGIAACVAFGLGIPALALIAPPGSPAEVAALAAAPVLLLPAAGYLALVELPRLRREEAALR